MTWPNVITFARLLIVPAVIWLILVDQRGTALILFIIAGVSDILDGLLARLTKKTTPLGEYLDPLADKALLVGAFVTLTYKGDIPLWLCVGVIFRDIMIVTGTALLMLLEQPFKIKPLLISKINTFFQIVFVVFIIASTHFVWHAPTLLKIMVWMTGITTFLSSLAYARLWVKVAGGHP